MQTRIALMVCMMFMLAGCGGMAVYRQIDLTYNPDSTNMTNYAHRKPTIYLQKPNIIQLLNANKVINESDITVTSRFRTITKTIKTADAISYLKSNNMDVYFMKDSFIIYNMDKNRQIDDTYVNVGTAFHVQTYAKAPGDWILGALGAELKASGYTVEYVSDIPDSAANGITININNIFSTLKGIDSGFEKIWYCRGYLDIDFGILSQGQLVNKFNIKHEADMPGFEKLNIFQHDGQLLNCNPIALTGTLKQIMQQAVPTIMRTIEGR